MKKTYHVSDYGVMGVIMMYALRRLYRITSHLSRYCGKLLIACHKKWYYIYRKEG